MKAKHCAVIGNLQHFGSQLPDNIFGSTNFTFVGSFFSLTKFFVLFGWIGIMGYGLIFEDLSSISLHVFPFHN